MKQWLIRRFSFMVFCFFYLLECLGFKSFLRAWIRPSLCSDFILVVNRTEIFSDCICILFICQPFFSWFDRTKAGKKSLIHYPNNICSYKPSKDYEIFFAVFLLLQSSGNRTFMQKLCSFINPISLFSFDTKSKSK